MAILHMHETPWRFCRAHLEAGLLLPDLEESVTFHAALMQGFIQAQAARIIGEQERLRSALHLTALRGLHYSCRQFPRLFVCVISIMLPAGLFDSDLGISGRIERW